MRAMLAGAMVVLGLTGCAQTQSDPTPSPTIPSASPILPSPTSTPSAPATPTTAAPATSSATRPAPEPTATSAGVAAFCDYLEETSGQQQQVEDPSQFVALVEGAVAVAPGAIAEDIAIYAESVRKLAQTVTAGPKQAARANQWLSDNEAAVAAAEANLDNYTQSVCGRPFITGEGG